MTHDLSASMLDAIERMGKCAITSHEIGVNAAALIALAERGLVNADTDARPALYRITAKGEALVALLNAPTSPVMCEGPISRIQRTVAAHFKIPVFEMWSERRSRKVARPRQVAMYFARELTPKSLPAIGRCFGKRDHTTVMHAIARVEELIREDAELAHHVTTLRQALLSTSSGEIGDNSVVATAQCDA